MPTSIPSNYGRPIFERGQHNPNSRALSSLPPQFQDPMAFRPPVHRTTREGQLKRIPRRFHQIALQIRFCRWPHINAVRFRWPGFLPTHFRRLFKRQLREFPQQSRMRRRHLLFLRFVQIRKRVLREFTQHLCPHAAFKLAFAQYQWPSAASRNPIRNCPHIGAARQSRNQRNLTADFTDFTDKNSSFCILHFAFCISPIRVIRAIRGKNPRGTERSWRIAP